MTNYIVRKSNHDDNDNIAKINVVAWQQSYQSVFTANFLSNLSWYKRAKNRNNFFSDERRVSFVAEIDQQIIGFCDVGPARNVEGIKSINNFFSEIYAIYVLDRYKSQGVGTMLFEVALNYLQDYNYTNIIVWTLINNNAAIKFYSNVGFLPIDWRKFTEIDGKDYEELAMCRTIKG